MSVADTMATSLRTFPVPGFGLLDTRQYNPHDGGGVAVASGGRVAVPIGGGIVWIGVGTIKVLVAVGVAVAVAVAVLVLVAVRVWVSVGVEVVVAVGIAVGIAVVVNVAKIVDVTLLVAVSVPVEVPVIGGVSVATSVGGMIVSVGVIRPFFFPFNLNTWSETPLETKHMNAWLPQLLVHSTRPKPLPGFRHAA